jgi:adenylyltransferase/sulfurtransferase
MARFSLSPREIDAIAETAALANPKAGALVTFEGLIRNHNEGRQVAALEYEVFDVLATSEGELILGEAMARFGLHGARCIHRSGALAIGDMAVWVGVTASHRDAAFRASRYIIDEIKTRLPIWKHETYADGTAEWVNCQSCAAHAGHALIDDTSFYDRQTRLPEIGRAGQAKLKAASVLIVGVGGLGATAAQALAGAGVGRLALCDFDRLSATNLHRQFLYAHDDVGKPKAELAAERLRQANPFIQIVPHPERFCAESADRLLAGCNVVLDCTDNLEAKFALSDACSRLGIPLVSAAVHKFEGELLVIAPYGRGGCLRCLWPDLESATRIDTCSEAGVLGAIPALLGTMQALEAIKLIVGIPSRALDHLILFDGITLQTSEIARHSDRNCAVCGAAPATQEKKIA